MSVCVPVDEHSAGHRAGLASVAVAAWLYLYGPQKVSRRSRWLVGVHGTLLQIQTRAGSAVRPQDRTINCLV